MRPIGIVSVPLGQTPNVNRPFQTLMAAVGHNTGNLLFTNAVWHQIHGKKERVGFNFDPEKLNASLSALVFPAANWFGAHVDFSELADLVEQLDIPVILIGLGTQDHDYSGKVAVPEGTVRFVRAVAERSASISVRGEYTREILAKFGIKNVIVTGCPSLYLGFQPNAGQKLLDAQARESGPTLVHSTRYSARHRAFIDSPSIHRELFRHAFLNGADILLQSEPEEISLLIEASQKPEMDDHMKRLLVELYTANSWDTLSCYLVQHAKVFFDITGWSSAMTTYGRVIGTRLHATIMALNSGVPAVLVHHDSRTREVSEFAAIPTWNSETADVGEATFRQHISLSDFDRYLVTQKENIQTYIDFLTDNKIVPADRTNAGLFSIR
jgi:hypothetical protein